MSMETIQIALLMEVSNLIINERTNFSSILDEKCKIEASDNKK